MASSLYLASLEPDSGKSLVALGLMEMLTGRLQRVGYFRPVVPAGVAEDPRLALIEGRYPREHRTDELWCYTDAEVQDLLAEGRSDEVFKGILEHYKRIEGDYDFVLVDGTDYTGVSAAFEFEFNAQVANHLGAGVCALVGGRGKGSRELVDAVRVARESLAAQRCALSMTMVNRVEPADVDKVRAELEEALPAQSSEPVFVLPEVASLAMPTVGDVSQALGAQRLRGVDDELKRELSSFKIAAMSLPNFLDHVEEGALIIAPGDRPDIIVGTMASRLSTHYPSFAGLVLTGGLEPADQVLELLDGLPALTAPVLLVEQDTYATAQAIGALRPALRPDNERKIATALGVFESHVDAEAVTRAVEVAPSERVTPLMFEYELIERARADRQRIVLPEGTDDRILQAAQLLDRRDVADLVLLGDQDEVRARTAALGLDLDHIPVLDPEVTEETEEYAERYYNLRKHKGIEPDYAREVMLDVGYFGTMMVHVGHADGMVSGAAHTTGHTIRPAFEFVRTKPGVSIVSSVFFMCLPDRVLVYGDCAVNPNPDADQLADIAVTSAETAATFGVVPRVAMLSYSTGESGAGSDVEKVREATERARERAPHLAIDGPIQYDAAVDPDVAASKMPDSSVAGNATVFIFPDLNTGNNTYKAVQRSSGAVAIGPVLQGLNKPVNDLSRGCLVPDIVNTVAITAIQAQQVKAEAQG